MYGTFKLELVKGEGSVLLYLESTSHTTHSLHVTSLTTLVCSVVSKLISCWMKCQRRSSEDPCFPSFCKPDVTISFSVLFHRFHVYSGLPDTTRPFYSTWYSRQCRASGVRVTWGETTTEIGIPTYDTRDHSDTELSTMGKWSQLTTCQCFKRLKM